MAGFVQDRWQFQDNVAWTKGKHSFKFGGGFQYGILYRNWDLGGPGQYEFANTLGPTAGICRRSQPGRHYWQHPELSGQQFRRTISRTTRRFPSILELAAPASRIATTS